MIKLRFWQGFSKDWRTLALAGGVSLGFISLVGWLDRSDSTTDASANLTLGVDTLIPSGFLLIPIEVQNYESLDSILGQHGVVDLFKGSGHDGRLVARNIRILRAPQNPAHFAVLVPESEAKAVLAGPGSFYVALKGPNQRGTQFVNQSHEQARIHFDGD